MAKVILAFLLASTAFASLLPLYQQTLVPLDDDEEFVCKKEGFYPNPDDCTKFIRCVDYGDFGLMRFDFDCAAVSRPVCCHSRTRTTLIVDLGNGLMVSRTAQMLLFI